ncbi:MAG TPA: cytochrome c [Acidimicrobiales bacterium]|nr:cytochrome c [Acidimicrobiales bacterium]
MTRLKTWLGVTVLACATVAGACASGGGSSTATPADRGKAIAMRAGCTSCHGKSSIRGLGPTWIGLAGSTVKLEDGSTLVADSAYLEESIRAPAAKKVAGYTLAMPQPTLSDDEITAIVAYIESLAAPPPTTSARQ